MHPEPEPVEGSGPLAKLAALQDDFELYPENVPAVRLFQRVQRSWRVAAGMSSLRYLGFDWCEVRAVLELTATPPEKWPELFDDLRVMEGPALEEIRLTQDQAQRRNRS